MQFLERNGENIPIHGGAGTMGVFGAISAGISDGGYRTTVPVHLVSGREIAIEQSPLWEEGEVPTLGDALREPARVIAETNDDTKQLVIHHLEARERATVPELARALERSRSTVLRALRELVDERRIERHGFARATRYELRSPTR